MDLFLPENKKFFLEQVSIFNPPLLRKDKDRLVAKEHSPDPDTIIGTRIRPLLLAEKDNGHVPGVYARGKDGYADVHELRQKVNGRPAIATSSFQFDRTYGPDVTSETIYQGLVAPLVPWAWGGGISTLFAYGQTGSGKTYTVDALARKAAEHLFDGGLEGERDVHVCVFELAGNVASDLLNDRYKIRVMEDTFGETQLVGALEPRVTSAKELLDLIERSMSFRKSAPTLKNDSSSRTHAVVRVKIVNKDVLETPDGLLFLIDLAGSEAAADVKDHSQERMKETREINASLSILKDCIRGRSMWYIQESQPSLTGSRVKQAHIPYRSSTLTKVLKHVFDTKGKRHCKTSVIACVGPSVVDAGPAKNTFRYAELLNVPLPAFKAPLHQDDVPSSWTPGALKAWIENNSGTPHVDASVLAPTENGIQICRLPSGEFISRCLKTPGVNEQHARAFYHKLIALHIDSRKEKPKSTDKKKQTEDDEKKKESGKPFFERVRPGMFVQMKPLDPTQVHIPIVMIMSPEWGFSRTCSDGTVISSACGDRDAKNQRYICCLVMPSPMTNAYEIDVRHQSLVGVEEMGKELLMEYDSATRYYYMTV